MYRIYLLVLIAFFFYELRSQNDFKVYHNMAIAEENKVFQLGQVIVENLEIMNDGNGKLFYEQVGTSKELMTKLDPVNMTIRVSDYQGNIIKDITISHNDVDIDLSGFEMNYIGGERKILIVRVGRYGFFILNLINYNLIGPIIPQLEGARGDSQDGTLSFHKFFNRGQYLIGNAFNLGMFCYNLMDLYNPNQIVHFSSKTDNKYRNYLFLENVDCNTFNGIFAKRTDNNMIDSVYFIFQSMQFELDDKNKIIQKIVDDKYLILNSVNENGEKVSTVIDYLSGEVLENDENEVVINELIMKE